MISAFGDLLHLDPFTVRISKKNQIILLSMEDRELF